MEPTPEQQKQAKASNVFAFPVHQRVLDGVIVPPDFKLRQTKDYLSVITEDITGAIVGTLQSNGVDCGSQEFKDNLLILSLMLECTLYRTEGIEHEFDELMDVMMEAAIYNDEMEENKPEGE